MRLPLETERPMPGIEVPVASEEELRFEAMGTRIRLLIGAPAKAGLPPAGEAALALRDWIEAFDRRLSRFRADSELSRLNADPQREVTASALLRRLVAAGVEAAEVSGGLVDPTLLDEIGAAGYASSMGRTEEPLIDQALEVAPARRPATADPRRRWRGFRVDDERRTVAREPGLGFDSGGIGKGLAADLAAAQLAGYQRYLIDCGGDIRVGGWAAMLDPYEVRVRHPLDGSERRRVRLGSGAIATSGIDGRIWRNGDGFSHHVLDPGTGEPAWTGVISATALAPTALLAETLAKAALLAGPVDAHRFLAEHGGAIVRDDGSGEIVRASAGLRSRRRDRSGR